MSNLLKKIFLKILFVLNIVLMFLLIGVVIYVAIHFKDRSWDPTEYVILIFSTFVSGIGFHMSVCTTRRYLDD